MKLKDMSEKPLPDWIKEELDAMEDPDEKILLRFEYMKEDFNAAIHEAGEKKREKIPLKPGNVADAVFSISGRVLQVARDIIHEVIHPEGGLYPAFYPELTRGTRKSDNADDFQARAYSDRVVKSLKNAKVEVSTYHENDLTHLEVNLVKADTGLEIRPFEICVKDDKGNVVQESMQIGVVHQAPVFPGPRPGIYIFEICWEKGECEFRVNFKYE